MFSQYKLWALNLSMSIRIYGQDAKSARNPFLTRAKKKKNSSNS